MRLTENSLCVNFIKNGDYLIDATASNGMTQFFSEETGPTGRIYLLMLKNPLKKLKNPIQRISQASYSLFN